MKAARLKKCLGMLTALVLTCSVAAYIPQQEETLTASAVSADYAAELVRISTYDNSRNLNISGTADHAACNTWNTNGSQNENWRFDYVGTNSVGRYFKIVNMGTGRLLTEQTLESLRTLRVMHSCLSSSAMRTDHTKL